MSVTTRYDEHRNHLRELLKEAECYARVYILDPTIWGYEDMAPGYALKTYMAVSEAYEKVK